MSTRWFVTATDTGVGKTEIAAALLSVLAEQGLKPFAFKPYESGVTAGAATDGERLRRAAGGWQAQETVCLHRFEAQLAPGIAAQLEGARPSWSLTLKTFADFGIDAAGVVEGAGGLFAPLDEEHDVIDLVVALGLPVLVVARAGLGTINHTTLTLRALAERRQRVAAVVLMKSTDASDVSERYNRPALEKKFPELRFVGPLPFTPDPLRRSQVVQAAMRSLVSSRQA